LRDFGLTNEWRRARVAELAADIPNAIVGGPFGSNLVSRDYVDSGVPVIRGQNLGQRWIGGDFAYVTPEKAASLASNIARPWDVVLTQRGTLGQVSLVPETPFDEYLISQSQMKLSVHRSIADPTFVYYALRTPAQKDYVERNAIRTGVPHTNLKILRETPILLPPLPEQRRIAQLLGAIDDKIELNRRMSETLEAIARALFRSWFVDFDPVRAKAEGRDPGLPPNLGDLFPDATVESPLGRVPRGWPVVPLGDLVEVARGLSYSGAGLDEGGAPMLNLNSIRGGGGYKHEGLKRYAGSYDERHTTQPGDVIVANTDLTQNRLVIGYSAVVPDFDDAAVIYSHHLYRLRPRPSSYLTGEYLCHLLNAGRMHQIVSGYANGTTVEMLPRDALSRPLIAVPPRELAATFDRFASDARESCAARRRESATLGALRDTLLPKLISGELRVGDADRLVEAAAAGDAPGVAARATPGQSAGLDR
jgi:type I restriction enzyme S subunit